MGNKYNDAEPLCIISPTISPSVSPSVFQCKNHKDCDDNNKCTKDKCMKKIGICKNKKKMNKCCKKKQDCENVFKEGKCTRYACKRKMCRKKKTVDCANKRKCTKGK